MKIRKGYKFRLKPKGDQYAKLAQQAGSCRFVYNKLLSLNDERYIGAQFGLNTPKIPEFVGHGLLKLWKQSDEYGWLKDTDSQVLQQAVKDLERGYRNFFEGRAQPPTKRKKFLNDSFRYPQRFKVENNKVYLPKIGWLSFFKSQDILGVMKNSTVSRKGDYWYISIQVEFEIDEPIHPSTSAVGIDLGIAKFATLSTGEFYEPLNSFRRHEAKLAKAQQIMSRKIKFSQNWIKAKQKVNHLHTKIANLRHDYLHQVSTEISKSHATIMIEDLRVANMSKSASKTVEQPGRQVAQKSGLNKSILDQGWGLFRNMLEYKQLWRGGQLIVIPAPYTSQTCHQCGVIDKANRASQAEFCCVHCGHTANADINAAQNILASGLGERLNAFEAV